MRHHVVSLALLLALSSLAPAQNASEWKSVDDALGRSGKALPGGVYKYGLPRSDMHASVGGVELKPALALGSWLAFSKMGTETMVMGDLVLAESEVEPVMLKLQQGGVEQTALHNHLLHESPRVMYMHVSGHGDAAKLAKTLHDALALTATPKQAPASSSNQDLGLDAAAIGKTLGVKGNVNGGVLQFSIPRAEKITEDGVEIPPSMGTATAINFQPTGEGRPRLPETLC